MNNPDDPHKELTHALRLLGQAQPPEDMEQRLAVWLRQRRAEITQRTSLRTQNGLRSALGLVVACSVVAAAVALLHHAGRPPISRAQTHAPALALPHAAPAALLQAKAGTDDVALTLRPHPPLRLVTRATREVRNAGASMAPSPLPLTEQEKLLMALARDSQLAMESGLTHVESAKTPGDTKLLRMNALFELDHDQIAPLRPAPLESSPIPLLSSNPASSGENE